MPRRSRDELPAILRALQYIFVRDELNEQVLEIVEKKVLQGKNKTGRYGMDLWQIFVLSVVRLKLNSNYDRLEDFANHHKLIRQIMGVETVFGEGKIFSLQRENKELISLYIQKVIMPKKGKRNKEEEAVESSKPFRELRHKHSAIESDINRLEHHGLDRCLDKGFEGYKRYCALGIVAANLHKLGNVLKEKAQEQQANVRKAAKNRGAKSCVFPCRTQPSGEILFPKKFPYGGKGEIMREK